MENALLIVWLLSGQSVQIPLTGMQTCYAIERLLDTSRIEASACVLEGPAGEPLSAI